MSSALLYVLCLVMIVYFIAGVLLIVLIITLIYFVWKIEKMIFSVYSEGGKQILNFIRERKFEFAINFFRMAGGLISGLLRNFSKKKI